MNIKKLKYDLALQCALVEVLNEQPKQANNDLYDMRKSMLQNFESYYIFYEALDESNFISLLKK